MAHPPPPGEPAHARGAGYAARFDELARSGADVHGEARFATGWAPPGWRVLDAGCGTGRVAVRLAELGYACVGVDVDPMMLDEARRRAPDLDWRTADLASLELPDLTAECALVVAAGNVMPLLAPRTEAAIAGLAAHLRPGGVLIAGFGLDPAHLPIPQAPFGLADYDRWCAAAGLTPAARHGGWDGEPYTDGGGYAVSVHRR